MFAGFRDLSQLLSKTFMVTARNGGLNLNSHRVIIIITALKHWKQGHNLLIMTCLEQYITLNNFLPEL